MRLNGFATSFVELGNWSWEKADFCSSIGSGTLRISRPTFISFAHLHATWWHLRDCSSNAYIFIGRVERFPGRCRSLNMVMRKAHKHRGGGCPIFNFAHCTYRRALFPVECHPYTECTLSRRVQIESHGLMLADALYGWFPHMRKEPLRGGGDSNGTVKIHAEHVQRGPVQPIYVPFPR